MTEVVVVDAADRIETIWRGLERVAHPPYVQSWGWIENWLASLDHQPVLYAIVDETGPIAAAFADLPVLRGPAFPALGASGHGYRIVVDAERSGAIPHVDLEAARAVEGGYASMLPAQVRAHLLHARAQAGEISIECATDAPRAHAIFDELLDLRGAKDNAFFRRLIDQRAPAGEIQLLRIRAHDATLGCLFNVTWHDHVVAQVAGFASAGDADLCHAAAIDNDANRGFAFYELQPADARLATGETRRVCLRFEHTVAHKLAG